MRTRYGIWSSVMAVMMCLGLGGAVFAPQAVYADPISEQWRIVDLTGESTIALENVRLGERMVLSYFGDGETNIDDWENRNDQRWYIRKVMENVFLIENARDSRVLTFKWNGSYYVACLEKRIGERGGDNQRWRILTLRNGYRLIENVGLTVQKRESWVLGYASGSPNFKAALWKNEN